MPGKLAQHSRKMNGKGVNRIPMDYKVVFADAAEIDDDNDLAVIHKIEVDDSIFIQQEKKLKLLKDYYIAYSDSIVGLSRAMCRVITHSNKQDIKLLVKSYMMSVSALSAEMDTFKILIRSVESPYAKKILSDLAKINVIEDVKKAVEKEEEFSEATNDELYKQAEKNKNEILSTICEVLERHNKKFLPEIIKDLIDAGQLTQDADAETGKYYAIKSPLEFLCWCFENGYDDEINAAFIAEHINTRCTLVTLKKYESQARDITETKRKPRRVFRKRINPV